VYQKPELLATAPNQVWSWDITKLLGPVKWTYFYLYVIMDIFSRYVVGWMVAHAESAVLAEKLIKETCAKQNIEKGQLTLHADRGSSMKAKPVALLLSDLGVTKTHSRPHTSDDNPYSEAQFKTLKYRPDFPERFGSIEDSMSFCQDFFPWYNKEHRHTGIGLLTPEALHYGLAKDIQMARGEILRAAYELHPERFVKRMPVPPLVPEAIEEIIAILRQKGLVVSSDDEPPAFFPAKGIETIYAKEIIDSVRLSGEDRYTSKAKQISIPEVDNIMKQIEEASSVSAGKTSLREVVLSSNGQI